METTNLESLKINFLTNEQYQREKAAGNLNENELYFTENQNADLSQYAKKSENSQATLSPSSWDSTTKTYSFESTYPADTYDLEVDIDGDSCTDEQLEAWIAAKPLSSYSGNKINAKGDIPTVDIPVILTVTRK